MREVKDGELSTTARCLGAHRRGDRSQDASVGALLEAQLFAVLIGAFTKK
jgi:hypothetical protein